MITARGKVTDEERDELKRQYLEWLEQRERSSSMPMIALTSADMQWFSRRPLPWRLLADVVRAAWVRWVTRG